MLGLGASPLLPLVNQRSIQGGDTRSADTTAEQTFPSSVGSIPPVRLQTIGMSLLLVGGGVFTVSVAGPTQRPRIKVGGQTLIDAGALSLLTNTPNAAYNFRCLLTIRAGGVIDAMADLFFQSMASGQSTPFSFAGSVTVDPTVAQLFALTTTYSAATAGNSNTLRNLLLTPYRAA